MRFTAKINIAGTKRGPFLKCYVSTCESSGCCKGASGQVRVASRRRVARPPEAEVRKHDQPGTRIPHPRDEGGSRPGREDNSGRRSHLPQGEVRSPDLLSPEAGARRGGDSRGD